MPHMQKDGSPGSLARFRSRLTSALAAVAAIALPATAQKRPPDAAGLYLEAFREMNKALDVDNDQDVEYPYVDEPGIDAYDAKEWTTLFEKTAVARALFAQAAGIDSCRFENAGDTGDFSRNRAVAFGTMREILAAHGWSSVKKRPEAALTDCCTLLAHARHLDAQGKVFASMYSIAFADSAFQICDATLERHGGDALQRALLERVRKALERHRRTRATLAQLADRSVADARFMLDSTIAAAAKNTPALKQARGRTIEMITELVAPMRAAKPGDLDKVRKAHKQAVEQLKAKHDRKRISKVLENGTGEALASVLTLMLATDTARLMESWIEHGEALAKIERKVKARLASLPERKQRPNPAPATYRQAVRDLRTGLTGIVDRSARLPRNDDLLHDEWRTAVLQTATARAGFLAATRIPECRWWLAGDKTFYELWHLGGELQMVVRLLHAEALQNCGQRPQTAIEAAEALQRFAAHARACPSATGMRIAWQTEATALELLRQCCSLAPKSRRSRFARRAQKLRDQLERQRPTLLDAVGIVRADTQRLCKIAGADYADDMPKVPARAEQLVDELLTAQPQDATIAGLGRRTAGILKRWEQLGRGRQAEGLAEADRVECWACHLAYSVRPQFERLLPALEQLQRAEARFEDHMQRNHPRDNAAQLYELALDELARAQGDLAPRLPKRHKSELHQKEGCAYFINEVRVGEWRRAIEASTRALEMFVQATTRKRCRFPEGSRGDAPNRLALLARMAAADAWLQAEAGNTDQAVSRVWALLAHARHVQQSGHVFHTTRLQLEQQALRILAIALAHPNAKKDREQWIRRTEQKLASMADGTGDYSLPSILVQELDAAMSLHHARLRDVHMKEPGGYRPEAFRALVIELIGPCADRARTWKTGEWIETAEAMRKEMLRPKAAASTTEKCARGFAAMLLSGRQGIVDVRIQLTEAAKALQHVEARPGLESPPRRRRKQAR